MVMMGDAAAAGTVGTGNASSTADERVLHSRILVVDDQEANVRLLEKILARAGYQQVHGITDPADIPDCMTTFPPDLILLDLHMPGVDGFRVLDALRRHVRPDTYLPILVLTADVSPDAKRRALSLGAKDFLTKPFDVEEVVLRVGNMLETRRLHKQLRSENRDLEARVRERTNDLEDAYVETFERLALAAEYRDDQTGLHIQRVGRTAAAIAAELGLDEDSVVMIELAAGLHDIGKIGVPDAILLKPARLTVEEFAVVETHTAIGSKILSGSRSPMLQMAEVIASFHHERWDGNGYAGMVGSDIPLVARITSVADTFDAMTNERPYKDAWPVDRALEEISSQREQQFDPDPVDAFLRVHERIGMLSGGRIAS
jgi:response regulator RpfG family c-di-GMP phosphodiesterase